ncbi:MAG: hypothetical protein ACYCVB_05905, partial [Bacilli bacterium]
KDYTDEEVIEQFYYNYQIHYALGLRNLGELYLAPRTLYEFRERVYRYTTDNAGKDDLIFGQFEQLTQHFINVAKITTQEQRMDSTQVMPNIKRAGRLSLLHDVLVQAQNPVRRNSCRRIYRGYSNRTIKTRCSTAAKAAKRTAVCRRSSGTSFTCWPS